MRRTTVLFLVLTFIAAAPQAALAQRADQAPAQADNPFAALMSAKPEPAPGPAADKLDNGIVAIVNEAVVSTEDMRARIALALLSAGMPDTPEMRAKLAPQVLRSLIEEQLQLQEGKKVDVSASAQEIDDAMKHLAEENRIPGGNMTAFLKEHNVPPSTLRDQVKAALTWRKVVMRELRPRVDIGDDEIDAAIQRMQANAGKQEYLVSDIFLSVDKPQDDEQVKSFAENLVSQIKGGAVFGALARQFSQSASAAQGGDIGWVQIGQLGPEVDKVLSALQKGEVAGPIHAADGYHIIGVRERRTAAGGDIKDMTLKLQQAFRPFPSSGNREGVLREAAKIQQTITDCDGLKARLGRDFPSWRWQDLGVVKLGAAPQWLVDKVANVDQGHAAEPMATDKGALVAFVCERDLPFNVNRDEVRNTIGSEKLELQARRLLRDLRKDAYIDIRMKDVP